jgi:hypothetical protein
MLTKVGIDELADCGRIRARSVAAGPVFIDPGPKFILSGAKGRDDAGGSVEARDRRGVRGPRNEFGVK